MSIHIDRLKLLEALKVVDEVRAKLPPVTEASYIVYKEGDTYYTKNGRTGQVEFSSSNASEVIQYAINRVADEGGGMVFIKAGVYNIKSPIAMKSGVSLVGEGGINKATCLRGTADLGDNSIIQAFGSPTEPIRDFIIADLYLDGSDMPREPYTPTRKGIYMTYVENALFRGLRIANTPATGLGIDYLRNVIIVDSIVENCGTSGQILGSNGFGIGTGKYTDEPIIIANCIARNNANAGFLYEVVDPTADAYYHGFFNCIAYGNRVGFLINGDSNVVIDGCISYNNSHHGIGLFYWAGRAPKNIIISNCKIWGNGRHGIVGVEPGIENITITGCDIQFHTTAGFGHGIWLAGKRIQIIGNRVAENNRIGIYIYSDHEGVEMRDYIVANNIIYNNGKEGVAGANDGIRIQFVPGTNTIDSILIIGNRIFDDQEVKTQRYAISIAPAPIPNLYIYYNDLRGNAVGAILNPHFATRIKYNIGYVTENSGVATISAGSTRVTVTHGLSATPTKVLVTPYANMRVWVENITDTSFDIVTDVAPETNVQVAWYAEV
jgi:hypothetical protein